MQQPSTRQQELERLYNSRRGHVPQISISDDNYHVTEALGSYYGDEAVSPQSPSSSSAAGGLGIALDKADVRPLSFVPALAESLDSQHDSLAARKNRRNGSYFETNPTSPTKTPLATAQSSDGSLSPLAGGAEEVLDVRRSKSVRSEHDGASDGQLSHITSSPPLNRQPSTDTAVQPFPLNDIDYESSPAAVAQELSNLQAIRRMSMNVDAADPDLPTFSAGGVVPAVAPTRSEDENDAARLFWVPARLHPELAPKEFKTFIEDRVDKIRRRSGDADALSPDSLERSGSGSSSLRRKKSMLSHQIDTKGNYEDGAERLERKRSKGVSLEGQTRVDLSELESLVSDPAQLMRRMSLDTARRSLDSGVEMPENEDMPILPPVSQSLKRSTRTAYRKGSLKKGERVPFAKRMQHRHTDSDADDALSPRTSLQVPDEPVLGLTRVQTEPIPPPPQIVVTPRDEFPPRQSSRRPADADSPRSSDDLSQGGVPQEERQQLRSPPTSHDEERGPPPRPQPRQFQSRLASGPGRTTAQLPGYNNTNPLPHIVETLADGTKVPVANYQMGDRRSSVDSQDRKRSHELARPFHRAGAHLRPVPGREHQRSSTLDDLSAHPMALPGSGGIDTNSLTLVPTFEDRKYEKKDNVRRSGWKWVFGSDDDDKKAAKEGKEEKSSDSGSIRSLRGGRQKGQPAEKARLDVLQNSIEGSGSSRGRESLVLNREDVRLDDERKKESKRSFETTSSTTTTKAPKEPGLLSAIFGGKKKTADGEAMREKKRTSRIDRALSPADHHPVVARILKPDIDYNWTRFSILEERAIYRMAHIKLANPRRALHSQVLLSNFMYSYLAKVQMMHPQVQIPAAHQRSQQRGQSQQQKQEEQQPAEYGQYQRWQQQQEREDAASSDSTALDSDRNYDGRADGEYSEGDGSPPIGYDGRRSSEEYDYDSTSQQQQQGPQNAYSTPSSSSAPNASYRASNGGTPRGSSGGSPPITASGTLTSGGGGGYSVSGTHDYLGYPKDGRPFDSHAGLWDDGDGDGDDGGRRAGEAEESLW